MANKEFTTWIRNEEGLPSRVTARDGRVEIISPVSFEPGYEALDIVRGPIDNLQVNEKEIKYTARCEEGQNEELISGAANTFGEDGDITRFLNECKQAECEDGILILDMSKMADLF